MLADPLSISISDMHVSKIAQTVQFSTQFVRYNTPKIIFMNLKYGNIHKVDFPLTQIIKYGCEAPNSIKNGMTP